MTTDTGHALPQAVLPSSRSFPDVLPGLVWAAGQGLAVLAVSAGAALRGHPRWTWLDTWDGHNFLRVATRGYAGLMFRGRSPMAFFPGYPAAIALGRRVSGAPAEAVGIAVSAAAGVVMAYGLAALVRTLGGDRRRGLVLVALASVGPLSVVFAMTYSEALFCAFAVWALVMVQRRSWYPAAVLCAAAGCVRPTGASLVGSLAVGLLVAHREQALAPRAWGALAVAPLGLVGYLAWVGVRTGTPLGWFDLQRAGWGTRFDLGVFTVRRSVRALVALDSAHGLLTVVIALAAVLLAQRLVVQGAPWPLVAYVAGVLVQDLGSAGVWGSKVRLLVPALPLLLPLVTRTPLGGVLSRASRARATGALLLATWAVLGIAYSAYTVDVYGYAL